MTEKSYKDMSASEKKKEDWMNSKWRPAMGWMYMLVCVADFVLFPILWSMVQALDGDGKVESQWIPITLQGAGLFHMAMGAILGIAAFGRTQEKIAGANNGGAGGYGTPVASASTYGRGMGTPAPYQTGGFAQSAAYGSSIGGTQFASSGRARPPEPEYPVI